jgi:protein required for attachment to host cells
MKPIVSWVLIADGARARILENRGPGKGLQPVEGMVFERDLPPSREILTDRPGRSFESQGAARHAIENTSDPHRELKRAFAKRLCQLLESKLKEGAFQRLVLVAPPVTMGDLRQSLPAQVQGAVVGEVVEDLTKVPNDRVPRHLEKVLAI